MLIEHHWRERLRAESMNAQRQVSERHAFSRVHEPSAIASPAAAITRADTARGRDEPDRAGVEPDDDAGPLRRGVERRGGRRGVRLAAVVRPHQVAERLAQLARRAGVGLVGATAPEPARPQPHSECARVRKLVAPLLDLERVHEVAHQLQLGLDCLHNHLIVYHRLPLEEES